MYGSKVLIMVSILAIDKCLKVRDSLFKALENKL